MKRLKRILIGSAVVYAIYNLLQYWKYKDLEHNTLNSKEFKEALKTCYTPEVIRNEFNNL